MQATKRKNVLKGEMAKYGVTITKLSEATGISKGALCNKLNGKTDFTLSEVIRILNFFNALGEAHTVETLFDIT